MLIPFNQKEITDFHNHNDETFEDTPEYKMLTDALSWACNFKQGNKKSVMAIISNVFDHVFYIQKNVNIEKNSFSRNAVL